MPIHLRCIHDGCLSKRNSGPECDDGKCYLCHSKGPVNEMREWRDVLGSHAAKYFDEIFKGDHRDVFIQFVCLQHNVADIASIKHMAAEEIEAILFDLNRKIDEFAKRIGSPSLSVHAVHKLVRENFWGSF